MSQLVYKSESVGKWVMWSGLGNICMEYVWEVSSRLYKYFIIYDISTYVIGHMTRCLRLGYVFVKWESIGDQIWQTRPLKRAQGVSDAKGVGNTVSWDPHPVLNPVNWESWTLTGVLLPARCAWLRHSTGRLLHRCDLWSMGHLKDNTNRQNSISSDGHFLQWSRKMNNGWEGSLYMPHRLTWHYCQRCLMALTGTNGLAGSVNNFP